MQGGSAAESGCKASARGSGPGSIGKDHRRHWLAAWNTGIAPNRGSGAGTRVVRYLEHIAPGLEHEKGAPGNWRGTRPAGRCSIAYGQKHLARLCCAPAYTDLLIPAGIRCGQGLRLKRGRGKCDRSRHSRRFCRGNGPCRKTAQRAQAQSRRLRPLCRRERPAEVSAIGARCAVRQAQARSAGGWNCND